MQGLLWASGSEMSAFCLVNMRSTCSLGSDAPTEAKRFSCRSKVITSSNKYVTRNYSDCLRKGSPNYSELCLAGLNIVPVINMVPSHSVYEGAVVEVVCKVVDSPLKDINLFLTKDRKILKKVTSTALSHRFTAQDGGSGELVCKAEWGNVQKNNNLSITVKRKSSLQQLYWVQSILNWTYNCIRSV